MARKRYLKKTPLKEALRLFLAAIDPNAPGSEAVPVDDALGRVTAEPVFARISSPHYHAAAMDGICVRAEDTFGVTEFAPKRLGRAAPGGSFRDAFEYVDTGNALPSWADAVIMIEKVRQLDNQTVQIFESVGPWHNVRLVGEDMVASELLLPRSHRLRPYDLGALLAAGHTTVRVKARPVVAIMPTGDELIEPGEPERPGAIIEFNSTVLASFVREWGGEPLKLAKVADDPKKLKAALRQALEKSHLVAIIAGSSAGERDFTASVIAEEGELLVHGIDIMPGKPAALGLVAKKPVIGVPGYPVSAVVVAREILQPAVAKFLGLEAQPGVRLTAVVPRKIASHLGQEEFVRVTLGRVAGKLVAVPLGRGAGVITTMVRADGLVRIPSQLEGINAGEEVEVELLRSAGEIENTILCTGSHDPAIGILEDQLKLRHPELKIAASNVGSLGGLLAMQRGETHIAGTHLLDPDSGNYNIPDIKRIMPAVPVVLVHLARREQGLMAQRGNPKKISGIEDLVREGVRFVNRQPGSGTRVLLDYELRRLDLDPARIRGYDREEFTHMAVGVAVASGIADAGLGVRSAANALGLQFIPIVEEQYDLLFSRPFYESERGEKLVQTIRSEGFKKVMAAIGGYHTRATGEVLYRQ